MAFATTPPTIAPSSTWTSPSRSTASIAPAPTSPLKARRLRLLGIATGVIALLGAAYGAYWAKDLRYEQSTDDAYVSGNVVQITPQVSGTVVRGCMLAAEFPPRTRHDATFVAPFQLANTLVP